MADRRNSSERGSALLLVPALLLVVALMGAVTLDRAVLVTQQADLVHVAQDAAAAGAAVGVDLDVLRSEGSIAYDLDAIDRAVVAAVGANVAGAEIDWRLRSDEVEVRLTRSVPPTFAAPGHGSPDRTVAATATARLEVRAP